MSRNKPIGDVIVAAVQRQARANMEGIGDTVENSYSTLTSPRDTDRLLSSMDVTRVGPLTTNFTNARAPYGKWLNDGTGIFGPHNTPIVPTSATVLRWVSKLTGDVNFRASVQGSGEHIGWWDDFVRSGRTRAGRLNNAIRVGWAKPARRG